MSNGDGFSDERKFYQHIQYLNIWKAELDRKAVNKEVYNSLQSRFKSKEENNILFCGTGTGGDILRFIDEGLIQYGNIYGFDVREELIADAPRLFLEYVQRRNPANIVHFDPVDMSDSKDIKFRLSANGMNVAINVFVEDLYKLCNRFEQSNQFDLIVGQAFIEHVNHELAYPQLTRLLKPGGLVYFLMNCDGWFNYSPSGDRELDERIACLFNDIALNNQRFGDVFGGEAFCGRNLPYRFKQHNLDVLRNGYGPSDWVITPYNQTASEMNFIKYTLDEIYASCSSPESKSVNARKKWNVKVEEVYKWYSEKLKAITDNSIGFTCVQKDIVGKKRK